MKKKNRNTNRPNGAGQRKANAAAHVRGSSFAETVQKLSPFSHISTDRFEHYIHHARDNLGYRGFLSDDGLSPMLADIAALARCEGRAARPQTEPTICLSLDVANSIMEPEALIWIRHLLSDVDERGLLKARFGEPIADLFEDDQSTFEWNVREGYFPFLRMVPEEGETELFACEAPRLQLITNAGHFLPASEPEENGLASMIYSYPELLFGMPGSDRLVELWSKDVPIKVEEAVARDGHIVIEINGLEHPLKVALSDAMQVAMDKSDRMLDLNLRRQRTTNDLLRIV